MDLSDLKRKNIHELMDIADEFELDDIGELSRQELIFSLLDAQSQRRGVITAEGVIEVLQDGFGFLRAPDHNYLPGADDIYVSPSQIRRFSLRTGDTVAGQIRPPKESERYFALLKVHEVNGATPEGQRTDVLFDNLTPIPPEEKLQLEYQRDDLATRMIDLLSPIGRGQRCALVAAPRTGKTSLLCAMARAIEHNHPDMSTIVLLIDERPEEVTEMRRSVAGEVISSTFDESPSRHIQVADIVLAKAKRLAESGKHVAVFLDSITQLVRAYNAVLPASDEVPAHGVDGHALHKAKRFFGAARNLEEGGSLTIVATVLVDTGSRVDEVIFEEFRDTSNAAIHLDRTLMERRVFPSIDIRRSGTNREEMLLSQKNLAAVRTMRAALQPLDTTEALLRLREKLARTENNAAFLETLGKEGWRDDSTHSGD